MAESSSVIRYWIMLICLVSLFAGQLTLTLTAHASVLRCAMCHTLTLALIAFSHIYYRRFKDTFEAARFVTFWLTVCYVTMVGLCIVNGIYSLQLLSLYLHVHYHELDVHYPKQILLLGGVSFAVKSASLLKLDCGMAQKTTVDWIRNLLFHLLPPSAVVLISFLRLNGLRSLIVWFDPAVNLLVSLIIACCLLKTLKEHVFILLLAVPESINVVSVKESFKKELPEITLSELTVWRDSKSSVNVNVKVTLERETNFTEVCQKIRSFFGFYGAQNVCVEPMFLL